jgi:hypothetical protein
MDAEIDLLISQRDLTRSWAGFESTMSVLVPVNERALERKNAERVVYTRDEVQAYHQACLIFNPSAVALRDLH